MKTRRIQRAGKKITRKRKRSSSSPSSSSPSSASSASLASASFSADPLVSADLLFLANLLFKEVERSDIKEHILTDPRSLSRILSGKESFATASPRLNALANKSVFIDLYDEIRADELKKKQDKQKMERLAAIEKKRFHERRMKMMETSPRSELMKRIVEAERERNWELADKLYERYMVLEKKRSRSPQPEYDSRKSSSSPGPFGPINIDFDAAQQARMRDIEKRAALRRSRSQSPKSVAVASEVAASAHDNAKKLSSVMNKGREEVRYYLNESFPNVPLFDNKDDFLLDTNALTEVKYGKRPAKTIAKTIKDNLKWQQERHSVLISKR